MAFTIYISDTSPELASVRAVLLQQISEKGMTATWLTDEERPRADMLDIVRRKIGSADAFISLITYVHGWTPTDTGSKSLTEIECDLAFEAVKPAAILLPETGSSIDTYLRMWALDQTDSDHLFRYRRLLVQIDRHSHPLGSPNPTGSIHDDSLGTIRASRSHSIP